MKENIKFFLIIVIVASLSILCWSDQACNIESPDEEKFGEIHNVNPTVTQEESLLIEEAFSIMENDPEKAIELLSSKNKEKSSEALDFTIASIYYNSDSTEKAEEYYLKALEKNEHFNRARANLAQIYVKENRLDEAIEQFEKVLQYKISNPSTYTLIGYTYLMKDKPVSAENAYRQALLLQSHNHDAMKGLAKSLIMQQRYKECIQAVKEILREEMENKELWYILANCYSETNNIKEAIKTLETAKYLGNSNPQTEATLGDLYLYNEQPDYAYQAYEKAFENKQINIERLIRSAKGLYDYGNHELSYKLIQKNENKIKEKDHHETIELIKTSIYIKQKEYTKAEQILQQIITQNPLNGEAIMKIGDLHYQQKQYEKAIINYERAERIIENKERSLIKQAKVEVERERYKRAAELLEEAQKIKPDSYIQQYLEQVRRFSI